jgi:hypothetical protein
VQGLNSRQIQPMVKFDNGLMMMWSCIRVQGPSMFNKIERRMGQYHHIKILHRGLLNTIEAHDHNPSHMIFHYDNDSKYLLDLAK